MIKKSKIKDSLQLEEIKSQDIEKENDIWSHPMNKGVPQHHKDFYNETLKHLNSYPKNEKGQRCIDGEKFDKFMRSIGSVIIDSPNVK